MRVLITGAGGFVARHAAEAFASRVPGAEIVGTSQTAGPQSGFDRIVPLDVRHAPAIRATLEAVRPTHVLHLAGVAAPRAAAADPESAWKVNTLGALAFGREILRVVPDAILLFAGSSSAYGESAKRGEPLDEDAPFAPTDEYGATKAAADLGLGAMAHQGLKLVRLRPFNHTGPGQTKDYVVPAFAAQIAEIEAGARAPELSVGDLDAERDFCDVRDVADAYVAAARAASEGRLAPGAAINLCSGKAYRVGALLDMLLALSRARIEIRRDPARMRPSDIARVVGDPDRAAAHLGWRAEIPIETTLRDVLGGFRSAERDARLS